MSVSDLRANLKKAMDRAEAGEVIEITKDGKVVALLVHPSRARRAVRTPAVIAAEKLHDELESIRARPLDLSGPGISDEYGEELIKWIRAARDRRR
jgi:antitoxin (DNA-binding transcriptional repressor) of toxin-antitoxin stability system